MRRLAALGLAIAALAVAAFVVRPAPTGGPPMRDFESYWAGGVTQNAGGDPYGRDIWRAEREVPAVVVSRDEVIPFVGPPYGLPLWSLLGRISYTSAIWVWGTLLGLALIAIVGATLRLCAVPFDRLDALAALALCGGFGPLTSGIALGQVAILATAATYLATLATTRRSGATGLALGSIVAALQPNLGLSLAAIANRKTWIVFAAVALALILVAMALPHGSLLAYLALLDRHGAAERFLAIQTTPAAVAHALGASAVASIWAGRGLTVLVIAVVAWQVRNRGRTAAERLAIACAAIPLALPFAHEHDFTIVFFPAVLAVRRARGRLWALAASGTMLVAIDWLGLAQRPQGNASIGFLAAAAACTLVVLAPRTSAGGASLRRYTPVAFALAAVVLGHLTHRLPTWPDALALDFHAPPAWDITQVWVEEQRRSGIFTQDGWWGALRALSLAGCGVIWFAVSRVTAPATRHVPRPAPAPLLRSGRASTPPQSAAAGRPSL